ncbi:MAG: fasciclin domain-containing protein [Prevotella sp.]
MNTLSYKGLMAAAALLAATSCSDFSDYNDTPVSDVQQAERTLWDNISQNDQLSDFATLVKKAGFDDELSQPHYYTVWAPLNGTYDATSLMSADSATVLYQFVKSHIAEYNHSISGPVDERIHALNRKSFAFEGDEQYTYAGQILKQLNLPNSNGIMHLLDGAARFYPNLYEYLFSCEGIDSVATFFKRYETSVLDTKNSVLGPTINGKQTYIDSVMITSNSLLNRIKAKLDKEDSTYTMLVPTNEAWQAHYDKISKCYNYINTTVAQNIDEATSTSSAPTASVTVDAAYTKDSLTRLCLVSDLVYNNNNYYNNWLIDDTVEPYDTLRSTTSGYMTNPQEIMSRVIDRETMSNGTFCLVDSLAFRPWESWCFSLVQTPLYSRTWTGSNTMVYIDKADFDSIKYVPKYPAQKQLGYLWVTPLSNYGKPQLDVKLRNVLSTTYNIYIVLAPGQDVGEDADGNKFLKPNMLDFTLSYCDAKGKLATQKLNQKVVNDPTRVDTLAVGTFTFPVAYAGLGDNVYPNLKITTDFGVFDKAKMAAYTRDFSIISILMKPVELEEFEATKE